MDEYEDEVLSRWLIRLRTPACRSCRGKLLPFPSPRAIAAFAAGRFRPHTGVERHYPRPLHASSLPHAQLSKGSSYPVSTRERRLCGLLRSRRPNVCPANGGARPSIRHYPDPLDLGAPLIAGRSRYGVAASSQGPASLRLCPLLRVACPLRRSFPPSLSHIAPGSKPTHAYMTTGQRPRPPRV